MPKLADLHILARNDADRTIKHEAKYPCYVSSDGTFSAVLPEDIVPSVKRISDETRSRHDTTLSLNKKGDTLLNCSALAGIRGVLFEYSRSMTQAAIEDEIRIFYRIKLDATYYKSEEGSIFPNGEGVPNYENDKGGWHGDRRSIGGWGDTAGSIVGVGARVCIERKVTPANGDPSWSYPRFENDESRKLGEWGILLNKWTSQPRPIDQRGERTKLKSIPYTEDAARMFHEIILRISGIADQLETHLSDHEALPGMIANGRVPLLQGPDHE